MKSENCPRRPRLGLFVNTVGQTYQNLLIHGAHRAAVEAGVDLFCLGGGILQLTDDENLGRNPLYDLVHGQDLDGYIVTSTLTHAIRPAEVWAYCQRFAPSPVCLVGISVDGIPSIVTENVAGPRELTNHLIQAHGRRKIGYLGGIRSSAENQERLNGFRQAMEENGLPIRPELVHFGDFMPRSVHGMVRQVFVEAPGSCDAVVVANDIMAVGLMEALDARGIRVPDQVAVVGFDDTEIGRFATPSLSTVNQQIEHQSAAAIRVLMEMLAGKAVPEVTRVPSRVTIRQSCGCLYNRMGDFALDAQHGDSASPREASRNLRQLLLGAGPFEINQEVPEWPEQILEAFAADLSRAESGKFAATLDPLLRRTVRHGDINAWHTVLNTLCKESLPSYLPNPAQLMRADELLHQGRTLVSITAERAQAQRRFEFERKVQRVQEMSAALRTSFDEISLANTVAECLPELGVANFYIALHSPQERSSEALAKMVVAHGRDVGIIESARGREFRCGELVPTELLPNYRHSMAVQPLYFGTELLGFCVFEMNSVDNSLFEEFREQISTALKGVRLLSQLFEEATRRQRAEKDRLESEMQLAKRIQSGILPKSIEVVGLEIAATILPATEVAGDYFDILPFANGCWIGIGDVVGHGLPAGIMMLMLQSLVAATVNGRPGAEPHEVWRAVNRVLFENIHDRLEQDEYATLSILRYDVSGMLTFSGAHEDLVICRARTGRCEVIATPGTWAGLAPEIEGPVPERECQLESGDVLLLYTDGISEAMNAGKVMFGLDRLCRELESVRLRSAEVIRDHLLRALQAHSPVQVDDVTLVVAKFLGPGRAS